LPFSSSTQVGWTAGAGIEAAFTPNLTGKIEYLYVDFANSNCPATSCGFGPGPAFAPVTTTVTLKENIVRAGINYKFW
jgi:outer membrane immunogenic protein